MIKLLLILITSINLSYGESIDTSHQRNECRTPGERLSKDYIKTVGIEKNYYFYRSGKNIIGSDRTAETFEIMLHKIYKITTCESKEYSVEAEKCYPLDLATARGEGNEFFKNFYDFTTTSIEKATSFMQNIKFNLKLPSEDRLNTSLNIINFLIEDASFNSIPNRWEKFSAIINKAADNNIISETTADEILNIYLNKNKATLGFLPNEGAVFKEGIGNGILNKFFSLAITYSERIKLISKTIDGINIPLATDVAPLFINFANINGIPNNWDSFVVLLNYIYEQEYIDNDTLDNIININEINNRENLGFQISAHLCKIITQIKYYNKIVTSQHKEEFKTVRKEFQIKIQDAPLLTDEKETIRFEYDGINSIGIYAESSYNTYKYTSKHINNHTMELLLVGTRIQITPNNSLAVNVVMNKNNISFKVNDNKFDTDLNATSYINVVVYEVIPWWPDRKIGTYTYKFNISYTIFI